MGKRILRAVIKAVALAAGMVFLFDNKLSGTTGDVLLGSIAALFACAFLWLAFGLGDDDTRMTTTPQRPRRKIQTGLSAYNSAGPVGISVVTSPLHSLWERQPCPGSMSVIA